eukprot:1933154-Rhodomonas_salina.3
MFSTEDKGQVQGYAPRAARGCPFGHTQDTRRLARKIRVGPHTRYAAVRTWSEGNLCASAMMELACCGRANRFCANPGGVSLNAG